MSDRIKKYRERVAREEVKSSLFGLQVAIGMVSGYLLWLSLADFGSTASWGRVIAGLAGAYICYGTIQLKSWILWPLIVLSGIAAAGGVLQLVYSGGDEGSVIGALFWTGIFVSASSPSTRGVFDREASKRMGTEPGQKSTPI